jgi:DNA-binding beta-propeller fold protein YncE
MPRSASLTAVIALLALLPTVDFGAQPCPAPPPATIALPGRPFAVASTPDGCWVFVSLMGDQRGRNPGVAVLGRGPSGALGLVRMAPLKWPAAGLVLTHDGKLLIVAAIDAVVFLDPARLAGGGPDNPLLGSLSTGRRATSIATNVSAGDKLLFVSEESAHAITVIDLDRARAEGFKAGAIIGRIPTGNAPIALAVSPDGKWLYATSQVALAQWNWPARCTSEGSGSPDISQPEGAVVVIDVARAKTDPAASVLARIPAGCSPVRLALAPAGDRLYVTARNSNAVLAFDTARLLSDAEHARIGMAPTAAAPVPLAVIGEGRRIVAGNSNRFADADAPQTLTLIDAARIQDGAQAVLGAVPAGAFPRDLHVSADGLTLYLANFGSKSLQVIGVAQLLDAAPTRPTGPIQ